MKKNKLLLVDDEKLILKTLGRGLREKGFAVTTAENKATAELKLKQRSYDIVVTDLVMEGLDGIELLKAAKKIDPDLSVIILTAYADISSAIDALREGADDYLLKPCNVDELFLRISRSLEKQSLKKETNKYSAELERTNKKLKAKITEHKQAQKALVKSKERYRTLVENINLGISLIDTDYNILMANAAECKLHNKTVDELIGKKCFWEFERKKKVCKPCPGTRAMATGLPLEVEKEAVLSDGILHKVLIRVFPTFGSDGVVTGFIEVVEDITERKKAEEKLKQYSEHLEEMVQERTKELKNAQEELVRREKLAMLGLLSSSVGHELRNPLAVISNAIYYLEMTLTDAEDDIKEYMGMISSEIGNAKKIVTDLLDFSRIRQGNRESITVMELTSKVLEDHPPPKKIKLTTKVSPDLPPVYVDPRQIGQVLTNLVSNAYQAMPGGGTLSIKAGSSKNNVRISVSDTGCGIASEDCKKIFEPLFTTKDRGVGLGLTITRNMVEVNDGSIELKSKRGKGATFTISLPITKER